MEIKKITKVEIGSRLKVVDLKSHKGTFGHALIIGGSYGKVGAVSLASKAALRTGCGLATAFIPRCGYEILQASVPEVMVITDSTSESISEIKFEILPQAIGIGPGMGQDKVTQLAFKNLIKSTQVPLVIDADALNILSKNPSWLSLLRQNTILTPHEKELERLIGPWETECEKILKTQSFAGKYESIIVLKGAPTLIVTKSAIFENTTGNPALATAGSGDVLTGMITSLIAQGHDEIDAAVIGVFIHGLSADLATTESSFRSFIASDIISNIGKAYLAVENHNRI